MANQHTNDYNGHKLILSQITPKTDEKLGNYKSQLWWRHDNAFNMQIKNPKSELNLYLDPPSQQSLERNA